jgi:predicted amino acid dehydrogenase
LHAGEVPAFKNTSRKKKATIDSALIAYWPSAETMDKIMKNHLVSKVIRESAMNYLIESKTPALVEIQTSQFGKSGIIMIPRDAGQIETISREILIPEIMEAVRIASDHNSVAVSLAGNLPSRTNYCYELLKFQDRTPGLKSKPFITSGHATTVVAVVKNIRKVLHELDIDIRKIRLGVVGFGSIGQASLSLLLESTGEPATVSIADLESQIPHLERALSKSKNNFRCPINIYPVIDASYPEELYESNLLIGASTGQVKLDLKRIRPGTIIVDDSFPTIIPVNEAIDRMRNKQDILSIGGGKIDIAETSSEIPGFGQKSEWLGKILDNLGYEGIPGCRLESMLVSCYPDLPLIHGLVSIDDVRIYYRKCDELMLKAVNFHLEGYKVEPVVVNHLSQIISSLKLKNV